MFYVGGASLRAIPPYKGELPFAPTMLLQSYTTYPKDEYGNQ